MAKGPARYWYSVSTKDSLIFISQSALNKRMKPPESYPVSSSVSGVI
jgi:hypothetical protein